MNRATGTDRKAVRWYREPWVWLLIFFPLAAVVGGMVTLYLAVTTSDGLVVDDYYKRGKAINRDLARDTVAAQHRLVASLELYPGDNRVQLVGDHRNILQGFGFNGIAGQQLCHADNKFQELMFAAEKILALIFGQGHQSD